MRCGNDKFCSSYCHDFTGGYGWFGQHNFNAEECNQQQEPIATISKLIPTDETTFSEARENWLVAMNSFATVSHIYFISFFRFHLKNQLLFPSDLL